MSHQFSTSQPYPFCSFRTSEWFTQFVPLTYIVNKTQRRQKTMAALCKFKLASTCPNLPLFAPACPQPVPTCPYLPRPAPTCPCLLRHVSACHCSLFLSKFTNLRWYMALVRLCWTLPGQVYKGLEKSSIDSVSCCLKLKTLNQTFCKLNSDESKNRRMFLLNKL